MAGVGFNVAGVVFYVAGVVFGGQQAGPGVLQGAVTNGVKHRPGSPRPQQPIGCQMWALGVAGVVFGGQQAGPKVLWSGYV